MTTLGVLVFTSLLLEPAVVGGRVFFERDVHGIWMAQSEALYRSVAARAWPPWDHTVGFGFPQVANPNQQSYYPPGWLPLLLAPWRAYTLMVLLHVALAVGGVYRLTRHYGLSRGAALTAGALYGASGPLLSLANVWHHLAGAAILPWLLLATERAVDRPCRRRAIAWGGVAALAVLAGSPDMCVLGAAIIVARVTISLRKNRTADGHARRGRVLLVTAGAAVVALGLSAAQWVPTLEAIWNAPRASRELANRAVWALDPVALAQLFLPLSFADLPRFARDAAVSHADLWDGFVRSVYLGLPAWGLALLGLGSRRRLERSFWTGVSVVCLLYSLGRSTPFFAAFSAIPPLSMLRYPSKFTIGVALGFAVLAGFGAERLRGNVASPHKLLLGWLAGAGAVAALLLALPGAVGSAVITGVLADARSDIAAAAGASLVAALVIVVSRRRAGSGVVSAACAVICVAELAIANHKLNPTAEPDFYRYRPPILDVVGTSPLTRLYVWDYAIRIPGRPRPTDPLLSTFMEPADPKARALALEMYLYPPSAGRWGLSGSYDQDLLGLSPGPLFWASYGLRWVEGTPAFVAALRNGGVDFVVALHEKGLEALREVRTLRGLYTRPIHVFSVPDALPRTYVVGRARRASTEQGLAALFDPGWNARSEVLIGGGPELGGSPSFSGWSRIMRYEPGRVQLEVGLSEPGYVVLLDAWTPGWVATTGGRTLPVETADGIFRAVHLPPGTHLLEMSYRPRSALAGLTLTVLTLTALAVGFLVPWRRALDLPGAVGDRVFRSPGER